MKFKEDNIWIDGEWHRLCACKTCGEVHAYFDITGYIKINRKIICCYDPDNWFKGTYPKAEEAIDAFIKQWSD